MPPKRRAAQNSTANSKKQAKMSQSNGQSNSEISGKGWEDLPAALEKNGAILKLGKLLSSDGQFKAFTTSDAITSPVTFGIQSSESGNTVLISVDNGSAQASASKDSSKAEFILSAAPFQWANFFQPIPKRPYQSYWGMFGMNIKQEGIEVKGDDKSFAYSAHFWRRALELLRDAYNGAPMAEEEQEDMDEDHIVSRYFYVECPKPWGRCKIFVEESGDPNGQEIVFLHTAGSDSRQYHGVMNDSTLRSKLRLIA